jgi:hypothetical protein
MNQPRENPPGPVERQLPGTGAIVAKVRKIVADEGFAELLVNDFGGLQ